jgi:transposase-like protein
MGNVRKNHAASFIKAKVALEAVKQNQTTAQLSGEFGVPNQIAKWRKHLLDDVTDLFSS